MAETRQVSINGFEPFIIYQADQISDVIQGENLFLIDRFQQEIHLTPRQPFGNGFVHIIYKDGRFDTILIEINSIQSQRRASKTNGYLMNLRGRSHFFSSENESNNQYFGNNSSLYGRINFTENTYFASEYRYRKTIDDRIIENDYLYYKFGYKNNYLYLGNVSDTLVAPFYFNEAFGRGGRVNITNDKNFSFEFWQDEKSRNSGQSLFFNKYQTRFQHSTGENEVWGFYNYLNLGKFTFITNGGLTSKSVDDLNRYSLSEDVLYNFRNHSDSEYKLRQVSAGFAAAPQGAYSLNTASSFPMLTYNAKATISSKNISGVDELNRDYIEGLFLTNLQYNAIEFGENRTDKFTALNSFGSQVFSVGLDMSYTLQSGLAESNSYQFSPYLQYFFSGDKQAGWSIRSQYQISETNYLTTDSSASTSENSVFLVKNKGVFNIGIGGGSGSNVIESATSSSTTQYKTAQTFINYLVSNDKQFSLNYVANFYENDVRSQFLTSTLKYIPTTGYFMYGNARYSETQNQFRNLSNLSIGFGFGFDLYIGEKDAYSSYNQDRTYLTVSFFHDKNNNNVQDPDEEQLSGETFKFNGDKESLFGNSFTKKVLPNLTNYISMDNDNFSSISERSISIEGKKSISIPVYKVKTLKYKVVSGGREISGTLRSSCDGNQYEINYNSKTIKYNESIDCQFFPEIADYNLVDSTSNEKEILFKMEKQKFVMYFKFSAKKKNILYKGIPLKFENNESKLELNSREELNSNDFNFQGCRTAPSLNGISYDSKIVNISIICD